MVAPDVPIMEDEEDSSEPDKPVEVNKPEDASDSDIEREITKIRANPVRYVCDWMEGNLLYVGAKVFKFLSLVPCSLILPSIIFNSTDIRVNFNVMILGSPSSGKSTTCSKFKLFTYQPIEIRNISGKKLLSKIADSAGLFSIIVEDFSPLVLDTQGYEKIKILEGALGDEKIVSYENMKVEFRNKTQGSGLFCGTWSDLKKYTEHLRGGLLSRAVLVFVSINNKQREEIADFINLGIGNKKSSHESRLKEYVVHKFYQELFDIQAMKNQKIPKIIGYEFDDEEKKRVLSVWKGMITGFANDINGDFKRELHDFYRFAVSSAFINIFNGRTNGDGILRPKKEDYDFALRLMEENLKNKLALIKSEAHLKNIKTAAQFVDFMKNPLKDDIKNIFSNLSNFSHLVHTTSPRPTQQQNSTPTPPKK